MDSTILSIALFIGSLATGGYFMSHIRKSKVQIEDSIFWIIFSATLLIISVFPKIPFFFAELLGIQSPANMIYLIMMFILIVHQFLMTIKISRLESKQQQLVQQIALDKNKNNRNRHGK